MTDQFSSLAPRDVAITLRSLRRRLDDAVRPVVEDDALRSLLGAPSGSTPSISETVERLALELPMLERALGICAEAEDPVVPAGVLDAAEREPAGAGGPPPSFDTARAAIEEAVEAIAETIEGASSSAIRRIARVAGGGTASTIDIGREAARTAISGLRLVERRAEELVVNRR